MFNLATKSLDTIITTAHKQREIYLSQYSGSPVIVSKYSESNPIPSLRITLPDSSVIVVYPSTYYAFEDATKPLQCAIDSQMSSTEIVKLFEQIASEIDMSAKFVSDLIKLGKPKTKVILS